MNVSRDETITITFSGNNSGTNTRDHKMCQSLYLPYLIFHFSVHINLLLVHLCAVCTKHGRIKRRYKRIKFKSRIEYDEIEYGEGDLLFGHQLTTTTKNYITISHIVKISTLNQEVYAHRMYYRNFTYLLFMFEAHIE